MFSLESDPGDRASLTKAQSCSGLGHFSGFGPRPAWDGPAAECGVTAGQQHGGPPCAPAPPCPVNSSSSSEILVGRVWDTGAPRRPPGSQGSQRSARCPPWSQLTRRAGLPPVLTPGTEAKAVLPHSVLGAVRAPVGELLRAPQLSLPGSLLLDGAGSTAASASGPHGRLWLSATSRGRSSPQVYGSLPFLHNSETNSRKAERKVSSFSNSG